MTCVLIVGGRSRAGAEIWPRMRQYSSQARFVVAGRGSEALCCDFEAVPGGGALGTVDDVAEAYAGASATLAPARTGGGSQLKLTESLARRLCVVMSKFAADGLPQALADSDGYEVAADRKASAIAETLADVAVRHARERSAWTASQSPGWPQTMRPVVGAIEALAARGVQL